MRKKGQRKDVEKRKEKSGAIRRRKNGVTTLRRQSRVTPKTLM